MGQPALGATDVDWDGFRVTPIFRWLTNSIGLLMTMISGSLS